MDVSQLKRIPLFSDASDEELRRVAVFDHDPEVLDEAHAALTLRGYDVYPFDNPADSIGAACG